LLVLGIETSCDETGVALYSERGLLVDLTRTQDVHRAFGGVVPELAARDHIKVLPRLVKAALEEAGVEAPQAVAVTAGPGLAGALAVGVSFAKTYAQALGVPLVGVNHLEAHVLSVLLEKEIEFPFLALLASGGHTEIVLAEELFSYKVLGRTLDDAAGEAFDKVAKILGLGYPGASRLEEVAREGNEEAYDFPVPKLGFNFSYSGLKTAVYYAVKRGGEGALAERLADLAASFQRAAVQQLLDVVRGAVEETGVRRVAVVGGVARNSYLREKFSKEGYEVIFPSPRFSSDNGAMVALTGYLRLGDGFRSSLELGVYPDLELESSDSLYFPFGNGSKG